MRSFLYTIRESLDSDFSLCYTKITSIQFTFGKIESPICCDSPKELKRESGANPERCRRCERKDLLYCAIEFLLEKAEEIALLCN